MTASAERDQVLCASHDHRLARIQHVDENALVKSNASTDFPSNSGR